MGLKGWLGVTDDCPGHLYCIEHGWMNEWADGRVGEIMKSLMLPHLTPLRIVLSCDGTVS